MAKTCVAASNNKFNPDYYTLVDGVYVYGPYPDDGNHFSIEFKPLDGVTIPRDLYIRRNTLSNGTGGDTSYNSQGFNGPTNSDGYGYSYIWSTTDPDGLYISSNYPINDYFFFQLNFQIQLAERDEFRCEGEVVEEFKGLMLYDSIKDDLLTDNYYINCFIIAFFLFLVILIVNAPLMVLKKLKGR